MPGKPKHEGKDEENLTHFFRHYPIRLSADRIRLLASALIVFTNIIKVMIVERTSFSDASDSSNRAEVVFSVPSESFVLR